MRIRPATLDDDAALRALDAATWAAHVSPAPAPAPDAPFFNQRLAPENVLVAEMDGEVVGYAQFRPASHLASNQHVLMITGLAVDPSRQRQGIARALLGATLDHARAGGARRVTLRVLGSNTAARALYESIGFEVEGLLREEFLLEGQYVDDVLMALRL